MTAHTVADWKQAVANNLTQLGYWFWLQEQLRGEK